MSIFDRALRKIGLKSKGGKEEKKNKKPPFSEMALKDYQSFGISPKFFVNSRLVQSGSVSKPREVGSAEMEAQYVKAVNAVASKNKSLANQLIKALS